MSDDILHTGRADIHHPKGPLTAQQPLSRGTVPPDVRDAAWQAYLSEDSVTGAIDAAIRATYAALTSRSTDARDRLLARHARRPDGKCVMCRWADGSVAEWPCPDYLDAQSLIEPFAAEVARVRAAVAEEIAEDLASRAAPRMNPRYQETHYLLPEQAAAIAREHAAGPSVRPDTDRTPDVGTPEHRALIRDLTDRAPCTFDHHGNCQAHGWLTTESRCPHARAKELLGDAAECLDKENTDA